ncbi:MAG: peptidyl-prolyl cis-trans isomerase [Leptospiraceae bacterium]|nr:peptidyl-prolyl cis-trans isomerase [Leptospiraceae bacterium]MDW7976563.1 peptidyl-prolyl cis-trans isomerase [Leptospiraceae bacterium]
MKLLSLILITVLFFSCTQQKKKASKKIEIPESELGEKLNTIVYVVGKKAITQYDIERVKKLVNFINKTEYRNQTPESFLIEKAIIEQIAEEEVIIVNDERLRTEIEKRRQNANFPTLDEFKAFVEKETQLSFEEWKEVLRYQILKQILLQIKVSIPQPEEREIEEFYKKHQKQIGLEVLYREIIFPRTNTIAEEKRIFDIAKEVHNQITKNPQSFPEVARNLPENVSRFRFGGGLRFWTSITDVASEDPIIAGAIYNLPVGSISPIFKNQFGQYTILKIEGKRPTPIEKVREIIRMRLFYEKSEESFQQWLNEQKQKYVIQKLG